MPKNKKPPVHTVPDGDKGWKNVQGGETISRHRKKTTAQDSGRKEAMRDQTEHRIHNKDGKISNSNSYGNDPNPPKDRKH
jgi:hypothetical protein